MAFGIDEVILILIDRAKEAEDAAGLRMTIEYSHPSEAVYLRVNRGRYWFGLRIAAHIPAYECSADFEQLIIPPMVKISAADLDRFEQIVREFVTGGGRVVADPREVQEAIEQAFLGRHRFPSTSEVCGIRHRLNFRAQWSFDEETHAETGF